MRQHYIPTQMAKTEGEGRGWTIPNAQEHVEQLELLYTACGNAKLPSLWKTVWQFPIKLNMYLPSDSVFSPRYLLKRNESICPHKFAYECCGFTCNSQKLETKLTGEWVKNCDIWRQWNSIQQKKGANYWYMQNKS